MVSVSEGTPGRGPDADSRTDSGDGQASTNGRPAVAPVRYGPRNGSQPSGANGRGGSSARTVPGPTSPQQSRAPQPSHTPANGSESGADGAGADDAGANGTDANGAGANGAGTKGGGPNGASPNGAGSNGAGSNGAASNGAHPATTSAYARPRSSSAPTQTEPSEQERRVADARIAAAARNATASKVRGGSAFMGARPPAAAEPTESLRTAEQGAPAAPADETAVIPAVVPERVAPDQTVTVPLAEPPGPVATTSDETVPEKGRGMFSRLRTRDRRPGQSTDTPVVLPTPAETPTAEAPAAEAAEASTGSEPAAKLTAPEPGHDAGTEPVTSVATDQDPVTADRPLTWRDRLGLAPKEPKPQLVDVPGPDATTVTAAAAGATAMALATGTAGTSGTTGTTEVVPQGRVAPSALVPPTASDTVVIPAVDAADPATPVAAPAVQPAAAPKPKVGAARRTRKARLRLSRVDPWSVMKTALLFSIAAGIILVVATYGVWSVLNASGLFDAVNDIVKSVVSTPGDTTPFRIEEYLNTQKIIGVAALIAVVDVLIFTALATLGSFLYNLAATVLGGLEVTLAED